MKFFFTIVLLCTALACSQHNQELNLHSEKRVHNDWNKKALVNLEKNITNNSIDRRSLSPDDWKHLRWASKVLLLLRGGKGLGPNEDIQYYLGKSKTEIVDELVQNPNFYETVLKFNYYFLGMTLEEIYDDQGNFNYTAARINPAFNSAAAVARGGDYFELFDAHPAQPITRPPYPFYFDPKDGSAVSGQEAFGMIEEALTSFVDKMKGNMNLYADEIPLSEYCPFSSEIQSIPNSLGLPLSFSAQSQGMRNLFFGCDFLNPTNSEGMVSKTEVLDRLNVFKKENENLIDIARDLFVLHIEGDIDKVRFLKTSELIQGAQAHYFEGLAFELTNSSTNYNRKRAAYVLDRFLCDNLLPIDVEMPEEHTEEVHGQQASCYACHYRLDPMAGFFKDYGAGFSNFADNKTIIFDDQVQVDKKDYDSNWLFPEDHAKTWNIGVIRSEKDLTKNYYGENLADLFDILQQMPEVKTCLTQRVFEYATSKNQNVDQGFIDQLAQKFIEISNTNSSDGIRYLFKQIALSRTFVVEDPETNQCYDFKDGVKPKNAPPCEVSFILEKKCSQCHFPFGGEKNLDLTTWKKMADGNFGFPHAPQGSQLAPEESFQRILTSLISTDPAKRMPYKKHMDPTDRETLFLWINKKLNGE